ncbi:MAG: glycosyltransferase [Dehalococcoidia bacterium]|jgi:dolichol-phosphate mannosyltransferase|nr:glycosyltransferase [Dehalococcoidia bacterium]
MRTSTIAQPRTVDVVIPALNEAATIGVVLDEIPVAELEAAGYRVRAVVIDNGCTDETSKIAAGRGAVVIHEPQRGKGNAVRRAFRETKADFVVMLDGDATYPAAHIPDMLRVLSDGKDVVIGSRLKGTRAPGAISAVNIVGNHLLTWIACILYGRKISDLCTGYWAFRGSVLPSLQLSARGFNLEAELFSEAVRNRLSLGEVPVYYRRRPTPTKLRALRDGMRIARMLLRKRFRPNG